MIYINNLNYNIKIFIELFFVITDNSNNYIKSSTLILLFKIFVVVYNLKFYDWFTKTEFVHNYDFLIEQNFQIYFKKCLKSNNLIIINNNKYFIKIKWRFLFF